MVDTRPLSVTTLDEILERIELFRGRDRSVTRLTGGLTNDNYKVMTSAGSYVLRHSSATTGALSIDRDHEFHNSVAAAASGAGAEVVAYRPADGILVVEFLEGTTLTDAHYGDAGMLERVALACRQLHAGPRFCNDFDMAELRRTYLGTAREKGLRLPRGYLDYDEACGEIELALRRSPVATVPCNNDLLAANLIDTGPSIRIIDYEYSGNNDPCFELGNLAAEGHLVDEQVEQLVSCYFGSPDVGKLARTHLQSVVARYGWTLWAAIQAALSEVDFDFWAWGLEKFDSAVRDLSSSRVPAWLEALDPSDAGWLLTRTDGNT